MDIIGKRVLIIGSHPHSGKTGVIDRVDVTVTGEAGLVIRLEDGMECFVFSGENLEFLE